MDWREGYIAVDWGTTNRRAYRIDADGRIEAQFADDLGVTAVAPGGFEAAVQEIRARLGDAPMLMAGMVGSNRGWHEAPYVACPVGMDALAAAIAWIEPGRTGIVPGVSQHGSAGADVMRGEEIQILGAIASGLTPADGLVCHPGTHAKWAVTAGGCITGFRTMMTGEIFALLRDHSILGAQLGGTAHAGAAFQAGVDEALGGGDLLPGLFRIRARYLLGEQIGDVDEGASYASGLLIGCDLRAGLGLSSDGGVTLIGRPDLCELYAAALARAGRETMVIDGATAFLAGVRRLTEMV